MIETSTPKLNANNSNHNHSNQGMSFGKTILVSVLVSLLVSGSTFYLYEHHYAPKILTVDFKSYVKKQRRLFLTGTIDEETLQQNLGQLKVKLKSFPDNVTVILKEAVLSDAKTIFN